MASSPPAEVRCTGRHPKPDAEGNAQTCGALLAERTPEGLRLKCSRCGSYFTVVVASE